MGLQQQQPQGKSPGTMPPTTGGKNQMMQPQQEAQHTPYGPPQGSQMQPVFRSASMEGMMGQNPQMGRQNMGDAPGQQGSQGFGQGFHGQIGQALNPNMGGLSGFANSAVNTLQGGGGVEGGMGGVAPGSNMMKMPQSPE